MKDLNYLTSQDFKTICNLLCEVESTLTNYNVAFCMHLGDSEVCDSKHEEYHVARNNLIKFLLSKRNFNID